MSIFNEANDLASQLVYGRPYQSNEPCPKPDRLVFVKGDSIAVVTDSGSDHDEWADIAIAIDRFMRRLPPGMRHERVVEWPLRLRRRP